MTAVRIVIPARYASERLPGKPLMDIHGLPMIVRVARQAQMAKADEVVVAVDDKRVLNVVTAAGIAAEMTAMDHASGSDRVMEVVRRRGWSDDDIVVNVQGDEPLVPPAVIDAVVARMLASTQHRVASVFEPIRSAKDLLNPNVVKVVTARDGSALYFSRAPIPYPRDTDPAALSSEEVASGRWRRHIGIYGYRVDALARFVALPASYLESTEKLEQLRLLAAGEAIAMVEALEPVPGGVDTAEDLERVRSVVAGSAG